MTRLIRAAFVVIFCAIPQFSVAADDQVMLVADSVSLNENGNLVANGAVEIFYKSQTLTAAQVIYDQDADKIAILGPLTLTDSDGNEMTATQADLSRDLQNGVIKSARLILQQQLRLDAQSIQRTEGRYSDLNVVAATSCQTCNDQKPLWQIRAKSVRYDAQSKQIFMKHAQLRVGDIPVFYLPWMRLNDPRIKRSQGFLVPAIKSTSLMQTGIQMPYFIPIGESRDITLTPYLSPVTRTLEIRYRQAFNTGKLEFNGAVSHDTLSDLSLRAHGKINGAFSLPKGYQLGFTAETVSDNRYLGDYFDDGRDRIASTISINKTDNATHREANLYHYRSLYENNSTIPTVISYNRVEHRFDKRLLDGPISLTGEAQSIYRSSSNDTVGRDIGRVNAALTWSTQKTGWMGLRYGIDTQSRWDAFFIEQDSQYAHSINSYTADAMAHLRWPFMARGASASYLIEPIVQLGYSARDYTNIPNEESQRVEFDTGNLLSLSRFAAPDIYERGLRGAAGLRWEMRHAAGYKFAVALGQVYRSVDEPAFSVSSGLRGRQSDTLLATQLTLPIGLSMTGRSIVDHAGQPKKVEILGNYAHDRFSLNGGYSLLLADAQEERNRKIEELRASSRLKIKENWQIENNFSYDLAADHLSTAGFGLSYDAQCAKVDFSVTRRFTDLGTSPPQTSFDLTVALKGFATGGASRQLNTSCGQ